MNDFSQPWDDADGVKGLWRTTGENNRFGDPKMERDKVVFQRICERRAEHVRLCKIWRAAAEADGWQFHPTYTNEPVESAFRGEREGFTLQGICREREERSPSASIHIWGPDGLAIKPPLVYDMEAIRRGARVCGYCGAEDVDTTRVGFAGRCCLKCEPAIRPRVETPGWNR